MSSQPNTRHDVVQASPQYALLKSVLGPTPSSGERASRGTGEGPMAGRRWCRRGCGGGRRGSGWRGGGGRGEGVMEVVEVMEVMEVMEVSGTRVWTRARPSPSSQSLGHLSPLKSGARAGCGLARVSSSWWCYCGAHRRGRRCHGGRGASPAQGRG